MLGRDVTIGRRFGDRLEDNRFQLDRDFLVDGRGRPRFILHDLPQQHVAIRRGEDRFERQQLVHCRAQRINVGAMVQQHAAPFGLLGTHIAQRAEQIARARELHVGMKLRQTEIGDPEIAAPIKQQIAGLDVAMDDAHRVGMIECHGRLLHQAGHGVKIARWIGVRIGQTVDAVAMRFGAARQRGQVCRARTTCCEMLRLTPPHSPEFASWSFRRYCPNGRSPPGQGRYW